MTFFGHVVCGVCVACDGSGELQWRRLLMQRLRLKYKSAGVTRKSRVLVDEGREGLW